MAEQLSVAAVRTRAAAQELTPQRILDRLESGVFFDSKFIGQCKALREELLPGLRQKIASENSQVQLQAGELLLYLGEAEGTDAIVTNLRSPETKIQVNALFTLAHLPLGYWEIEKSLGQEPVPLKRELVFSNIKPFLSDPETQIGNLALQVAINLDLPEADSVIVGLLRHPVRRVSTSVLGWLARRKEDAGAFEVAKGLLVQPGIKLDEQYWVIVALATYCESGQPELVQQAAQMIADFTLSVRNEPGHNAANLIWWAFRGLKAAHYADEYRILEAVYQSSIQDMRRGIALERLGEIEGVAAIDHLRSALKDEMLRIYAARLLAKDAKSVVDPLLRDELVDLIAKEKRPVVLGTLLSAFLTLDGDITVVSSLLENRVDPFDATRIFWLTHQITPNDAIRLLIEAGAISMPLQETLKTIKEKWQKDQQPVHLIESLLIAENRLAYFNCDAGSFPVDYVGLIEENFLKISQDIFSTEFISQQYDENKEESEIQFIYHNQAYSFTARNDSHWYDVVAVLKGLNGALADAGRDERFLTLYSGNESTKIIFAPEAGMRNAAKMLQIPLADLELNV